MPLIIFNTWKAEYLYMLGTAGVAEDVSAFVQDAILQESKINSSFKGIKDQTGDKLILEVEIDSIGAIGTYKSEGMVVFAGFFLVSSSNEAGVPGTAFSRFRWQLKRGDNLLASNVVSSSYSSRPWLQEGGKRRALRSFYNANLVEALSKTLKSNIENIVQAVDLYLVEERRGRN